MERTKVISASAVASLILILDVVWMLRETGFQALGGQAVLTSVTVAVIAATLIAARFIQLPFMRKSWEVIANEKDQFLIIKRGSSIRAVGGIEVHDPKRDLPQRTMQRDYAEYRILHEKGRDMLKAILENRIPCIYMVSFSQRDAKSVPVPDGEDQNTDSQRMTEYNARIIFLTFGQAREESEAIQRAQANILMIKSALTTTIPSITVQRLGREEIHDVHRSFFLDAEVGKVVQVQ